MAEIAKMAERIVKKAKEYDRDTIPGDYATLKPPCPNCGGVVKENYGRFTCTGKSGDAEGCGFHRQDPGGRSFELDEVEASSPTRRSARWKASAPRRLAFTAELKLVRRRDRQLEAGVRFRRGRAEGRGRRRAGRFLRPGIARRLPKCQGVFEHGSYVCEHAVGAHVTCDFKSGKIILQQPVAREQMTKLLATGKTDLLENFVSNKTRRKFKAYLAYDKKEGWCSSSSRAHQGRDQGAGQKAAAKKSAVNSRAA